MDCKVTREHEAKHSSDTTKQFSIYRHGLNTKQRPLHQLCVSTTELAM